MTLSVPKPKVKFDVLDHYVNDCEELYSILTECPLIPFREIGQLIAEFAATEYSQCVWCGITKGYVDCIKDFKIKIPEGSFACADENDKIRYFITDFEFDYNNNENWENTDADGFRSDGYELEFNHNIPKILCLPCSVQWKCIMCHYQALDYNYDTNLGECLLCWRPLCVECAAHQCMDQNEKAKKEISHDFEEIDISNAICSFCIAKRID